MYLYGKNTAVVEICFLLAYTYDLIELLKPLIYMMKTSCLMTNTNDFLSPFKCINYIILKYTIIVYVRCIKHFMQIFRRKIYYNVTEGDDTDINFLSIDLLSNYIY